MCPSACIINSVIHSSNIYLSVYNVPGIRWDTHSCPSPCGTDIQLGSRRVLLAKEGGVQTPQLYLGPQSGGQGVVSESSLFPWFIRKSNSVPIDERVPAFGH